MQAVLFTILSICLSGGAHRRPPMANSDCSGCTNTRASSIHGSFSQPLQTEENGTELPSTLTFAWPVNTQAVNSIFGQRQDPLNHGSEFHCGVDLHAHYGDIIRAAAPGRVTLVGHGSGHGLWICLSHPGNYETCYAHMSRLLVHRGSWVPMGSPVGRVGRSGRSTGPHLHFELLQDGTYVDPMLFLGRTVPLD